MASKEAVSVKGNEEGVDPVGLEHTAQHPSNLEGCCAVCGLKTILRCQGCIKGGKDAKDIPFYCGKEHQTSHWKSDHKAKCGRPITQGWKIVRIPGENDNLPYYKAIENLKPGHVLFTQKPLLVFPFIISNQEVQAYCSPSPQKQEEMRSITKRTLWTCLSCYELMSYGNLVLDPIHGLKMNKCSECGWPIHSSIVPGEPPSSCQELHIDECSLLTKNRLKWETLVDSEAENLYYYLGLVRAVLLPPELKKELLNLPVFRPDLYPLIKNADKMIHFVRHRCNLKDKVSETELKKMMLIIFSNSLTSGCYTSFRKIHTLSVYRGGSTGRVLPHDCRPNCDYYINIKTLEATFKTTREVEKGEKLSLNYFTPAIYTAIYERLLTSPVSLFMMPCSCKRCHTSHEDHTYLSAIRCPAVKHKRQMDVQYLVPISKLSKPVVEIVAADDIFVWRCISNDCSYQITQTAVKQLIDKIILEIEQAGLLSDYAALRSIVEKYSGEVVHPKNSAMVMAQIKMANVAMKYVKNLEPFRKDGFKFDLHAIFLGDFDKLIETYDQLQPGRSENKGFLLFYQALLKMSKLSEKLRTPGSAPKKDELIEELNMIKRNLKESWIIAKENPFWRPTDKLEELTLQKLYANHLASSINKVGDFAELPVVKSFCKKYTDENVMNFWHEWESKPVKWTMIPGNELPQLLAGIATDEQFLQKVYNQINGVNQR